MNSQQNRNIYKLYIFYIHEWNKSRLTSTIALKIMCSVKSHVLVQHTTFITHTKAGN